MTTKEGKGGITSVTLRINILPFDSVKSVSSQKPCKCLANLTAQQAKVTN